MVILALGGLALQAGEIDFSGISFLRYRNFIEGGSQDGIDAFDVNRVYFNVKSKIGDRSRFRFTTDINRVTGENRYLRTRVKYAWFGYKPIGSEGEFKFGLIPTPFIGMEDGNWKHRFAYQSVSDQEGWLDSADFGASWSGKGGNFSYTAFVANGEGYGGSPAGTGEVAGALLTYKSEGGLSLSLYGQDGRENSGGGDVQRGRLIGNLTYLGDNWMIAGSYGSGEGFGGVANTDIDGWWLYGSVDYATDWDLFWRVRQTSIDDPTAGTGEVEETAWILGVAHQMDRNLRLSLDLQSTSFDNAIGVDPADQVVLFAHVEVKF